MPAQSEESFTPVEDQPRRWGAAIAAAFVSAQGALGAVTKDRKAKVEMKAGGSYSYTYADLASIQDDVRAAFFKNGLAHSQDVVSRVHSLDVYTLIVHSSGESVTFGPLTFEAGATPQATGSAITYARRYALLAALGLATEDDDGQAARNTRSDEPEESAEMRAAAVQFRRLAALDADTRERFKAVRAKSTHPDRSMAVPEMAANPSWTLAVKAMIDTAQSSTTADGAAEL